MTTGRIHTNPKSLSSSDRCRNDLKASDFRAACKGGLEASPPRWEIGGRSGKGKEEDHLCSLVHRKPKRGKVMKRRKGLTEKRTKPRLTHTRANTRPLRFDLDADARIVAFVARGQQHWRHQESRRTRWGRILELKQPPQQQGAAG